MAIHDHEYHLADQYIELTRTTPRRLASQAQSDGAEGNGAPGASGASPAEAEHSLRRIERRIGSIA